MIVYKTTNLINGKFYIGQDSKNDPSYLGSGSLLKKAIKKYGRKNFIKETVETCSSLEELNDREIYWIKETKSQHLGYNVSDGGFRGSFVWSEEQRKIHSDFMKNKFDSYSDEWIYYQTKDKTGSNGPNFGKKHSDKTKEKISIAQKRNPTKYWLGKTQSEESNQKRREKSLGSKRKQEYKEKITGEGNAFFGRKHSEETKQKMQQLRKNKTPHENLERYIKFYVSKTGSYPSEEKIQLKLEEYKNVSSL